MRPCRALPSEEMNVFLPGLGTVSKQSHLINAALSALNSLPRLCCCVGVQLRALVRLPTPRKWNSPANKPLYEVLDLRDFVRVIKKKKANAQDGKTLERMFD